MRLTGPILAAGGAAALITAAVIGRSAAPPAPVSPALPAHAVAAATAASGPTVTVVGTGTVAGTPDQATMTFGVEVGAAGAAAAFSGEAAQAQRLIDALRGAGVAESDIQTQWVSLYLDPQTGRFTASSSVSAVIHGLARAGSVIDAAVRATGDSIRLSGISLAIADTSSLMQHARAGAVRDAQAKAQEYAQAAGLKLGPIVSISETGDTAPRPVYYGAPAAAGAPQPIEAGQQTLQVSVTAVYSLAQ